MSKNFLIIFIILLIVPLYLYCEDFYIKSKDTINTLDWLNDSENWGPGIGKISPGDTVYIAESFITPPGKPAITVQGSGEPNNEIRIVFNKDVKISSAYFGVNGGILVQNKEYIILDGGDMGVLESTANGSPDYFAFTQENIGIYLYGSDNCTVKNFSIRNIYQAKLNEQSNQTYTMAVYVNSCSNVHVQNNLLYYAGQGVRVLLADDQDIFVHGNTITRIGCGVFCGLGMTGDSGSNVQIYNNKITDTTDWYYNDGIKFFGRPDTTDALTGIKIYNNEIGPKISYAAHYATSWILVDQGWLVNPEIYNNLLIGDSLDNPANGYITVGGNGHVTGQTLAQNSKIYNNTIITDYTGIDIGILVGKRSTGHNIYNNLFKFPGNLVAIHINDTQTTISNSNNNCFYTPKELSFTYDTVNHTYDEWKAAHPGFETNSIINKMPQLNSVHFPIKISDSKKEAIIDKGLSLIPDTYLNYSNTDIRGVTRSIGSSWDIGAYEFDYSMDTENMPMHLRLK